ncbi:MAG: hypothetical protein AAFW76_04905 [Pseudomonadota bacterium]
MIAAKRQRRVKGLGLCLTLSALALSAGVMLAPASQAQFEQSVANDEGVDAIRLAIKRSLARFAQSIPQEINLVLQGPVEVAIDGQSYTAAVPALGLRAADEDDIYELNLGPTLSIIEPLGANRVAAEITPSEQLVGTLNDETMFSIDWVTRIAEATFNTEFGFAEAFEFVLDQVKFIDVDGGSTLMDIAELVFDGAYEPAGPDRVDGVGSLVATDVRMSSPETSQEVTIGWTTFSSDVQQFDLSRYQDYLDFYARLSALSASESALTFEQAEFVADELIGFFTLFDAALQRFEIKDARVDGVGEQVGVHAAELAVSVGGLLGDVMRLTVAGDVDSPDVSLDGTFDAFVPRRVQVDAALASIPVDLVKESVHKLTVGTLAGVDGDDIADEMHDQLDKLMNTDAKLDVASVIVELDDSAAFVDGTVNFDPQAAFGAFGQGSIRLVGLENLIEKTRDLPNGPQVAAFLAFLLAAGQQEDGADGMSVRLYEVEVTPGGTALLNGADIGPLLQQLN